MRRVVWNPQRLLILLSLSTRVIAQKTDEGTRGEAHHPFGLHDRQCNPWTCFSTTSLSRRL